MIENDWNKLTLLYFILHDRPEAENKRKGIGQQQKKGKVDVAAAIDWHCELYTPELGRDGGGNLSWLVWAANQC